MRTKSVTSSLRSSGQGCTPLAVGGDEGIKLTLGGKEVGRPISMIELNDLDVELDNLDRWDWMHGDRDIKIYVSTYLSIGRLGDAYHLFSGLAKTPI